MMQLSSLETSVSIQERDYMRKGPDWEQRLRRARKKRRVFRAALMVAVLVVVGVLILSIQSSWAAGEVEWIYPYVWNQPLEYVLAGALVLIVLGWPLFRRLLLRWRNRRTRRTFERRQQRQWSGHKRE